MILELFNFLKSYFWNQTQENLLKYCISARKYSDFPNIYIYL